MKLARMPQQMLLTPRKLTYVRSQLQRTADVEGSIIEVGIFQGAVLAHLAKDSENWNKKIVGYDTFEGLPDTAPIDHHRKGEFKNDGIDAIKERFQKAGAGNVEFIQGFFPDSALKEKISFCHLDIDLYEGTLQSLHFLDEHMSPGGLIVLDDWNWPACPGVNAAWNEYQKKESKRLELIESVEHQATLLATEKRR